MSLARLAHLAKLHELQASLDGLLVLAGMVVHLLAGRASQFDQVVLRHKHFIRMWRCHVIQRGWILRGAGDRI